MPKPLVKRLTSAFSKLMMGPSGPSSNEDTHDASHQGFEGWLRGRFKAQAVAHAVEELGFGAYQLLKLFLCGGIFLAEGAEMLIMGRYAGHAKA